MSGQFIFHLSTDNDVPLNVYTKAIIVSDIFDIVVIVVDIFLVKKIADFYVQKFEKHEAEIEPMESTIIT